LVGILRRKPHPLSLNIHIDELGLVGAGNDLIEFLAGGKVAVLCRVVDGLLPAPPRGVPGEGECLQAKYSDTSLLQTQSHGCEGLIPSGPPVLPHGF
jgi:hypothetical protein